MTTEDRFLERLRKKARRGLRGWPAATIAFYGPNLDRATKAAVGIVPAENAEVGDMQSWEVEDGDVSAPARRRRANPGIHPGARSAHRGDDRRHYRLSTPGRHRLRKRVVSVCVFWHGRDRFS
jgi:hypothetical protein